MNATGMTINGLALTATHVRTQLAALARDKYLSGSDILDYDKKQLRSMPLNPRSLFQKEWTEAAVDRATKQKELANRNRQADQQDRITNALLRGRFQNSQPRNRNQTVQKTQPQPSTSHAGGFSGNSKRKNKSKANKNKQQQGGQHKKNVQTPREPSSQSQSFQ